MIIDQRVFGKQKLVQQMKLKWSLNLLNDTRYMNITFGYPILIKDNILEKFNDVHKITKNKRKKKLSPTVGGDIVSVFRYNS